jgi:glycosyltransferase involved in cell wall biosynthesis
MNPKISIIVPVYNVEKYLERCVNSLLSQTYQNLEIILIDDESPDRCPKICEEFAKKDNRIIVVHQANAGLACVRNRGIEVATGDFIAFIDSDDWISSDTYEYCLDLICKYNADIVQFQLGYAYDSSTILKNKPECITQLEGKDILDDYMYSTTVGIGGSYSVCTCLFKKGVIKDIRFRSGKINEDIDFKYKVFSKAKKLVNSNQKKYYYFQQEESTSMGGLQKKDFDLYDAAEELDKLSRDESYGQIRKHVLIKKARTPLSLLCKIAYFGVADKSINEQETINKLTKELRDNLGILFFSKLPLSRRLLALSFSINYKLTKLLIHTAKRK